MSATLLLAEDSLTIQRIIDLTFASEGIRVIAVGDGEAAIERIDAERPDIVLADVSMPKIDGYALASHIKASPHFQGIPVLLLTGAFEPIDEARVRATGCDGILVKPFEPRQLVTRVKELLARYRAQTVPSDFDAELGAPGVPSPAVGRTALANDGMAAEIDVEPHPAARLGATFEAESSPEDSRVVNPLDLEFDQIEAAFAHRDTQSDLDTTPVDGRIAEAGHQDRNPPAVERVGVIEPVGASARDSGASPFGDSPVHVRDEALSGAPVSAEKAADDDVTAVGDVKPDLAMAGRLQFVPTPAPGGVPAKPARTATRASIASVFSALLAAEQAPPPAPSAPAVSEAMVEELVRRVLTRMTEESVRRLVVDTAERVIRQEIDRIKADAH